MSGGIVGGKEKWREGLCGGARELEWRKARRREGRGVGVGKCKQRGQGEGWREGRMWK